VITETDTSEAITAVAESDTTGLRVLCSFCNRELPHSNPNAKRISHGACKPLCQEGHDLGWGKYITGK
jgi:hypothetical protein